MSFVGLDGLRETLTAGISATDTALPTSNAAALCARLGSGTSRLEITDGTFTEVVTLTGCTGGVPQVLRGQEGTTPLPFVAGSCVRFVLTTGVVCAMITAGGCSTAAACTALNVVAGKTLPAAVVGQPYSHVLAWTGTTPVNVTILQKPAWLNVSPVGATTGTSVVFSGTPPASSTGDFVQFVIDNCGGKYELNQRLDYCESFGATA